MAFIGSVFRMLCPVWGIYRVQDREKILPAACRFGTGVEVFVPLSVAGFVVSLPREHLSRFPGSGFFDDAVNFCRWKYCTNGSMRRTASFGPTC